MWVLSGSFSQSDRAMFIGMWFGEDSRVYIKKTFVQNILEYELHLHLLITTLQSILDAIGRAYVSN